MKGYERYVNGTMKAHDFLAERPLLAMGQNPFAAILMRGFPRGSGICLTAAVMPSFREAGNFADVNLRVEHAVAV